MRENLAEFSEILQNRRFSYCISRLYQNRSLLTIQLPRLMSTHLISYTLHKPTKDYSSLYAAIRALTGTYWHKTTSAWLVSGNLTSKQIYDHLAPHIDDNDELVVFKLSGEWYGRILDQTDLNWLKNRTF